MSLLLSTCSSDRSKSVLDLLFPTVLSLQQFLSSSLSPFPDVSLPALNFLLSNSYICFSSSSPHFPSMSISTEESFQTFHSNFSSSTSSKSIHIHRFIDSPVFYLFYSTFGSSISRFLLTHNSFFLHGSILTYPNVSSYLVGLNYTRVPVSKSSEIRKRPCQQIEAKFMYSRQMIWPDFVFRKNLNSSNSIEILYYSIFNLKCPSLQTKSVFNQKMINLAKQLNCRVFSSTKFLISLRNEVNVKYCPKIITSDLVNIPRSSVFEYIFRGINRILRKSMLGNGNFSKFFNFVKSSIFRPTFQQFAVHEFLKHVKLSKVPWLCIHPKLTGKEFNRRSEIFKNFYIFLFHHVINPLVSFLFYASETAHSNNKILFFSHKFWTVYCAQLLPENLTLVRKSQMIDCCQGSNSLWSGIRFIAKPNGVLRPIVVPLSFNTINLNVYNCLTSIPEVNVSRRSTLVRNENFITFNSRLKNLFAVLSGISGNFAEKLADSSSVSNLNHFLQSLDILKKQNNLKYFLVQFDMSKAFDSLDHSILIKIVKSLLTQSEYTLFEVSRSKESIRSSSQNVNTFTFHHSLKFIQISEILLFISLERLELLQGRV
ncbi:hypothetical protein GEMRC1_006702 [Eukaryota sp. GEM-RC1]